MTDLRKLLDAATKGPWHACREGECSCGMIWSKATDSHIVTAHDEWGDGPDAIYGTNGKEAQRGNAALIVAAVNALPDLLNIVEAAQRHMAASDRVQDDSTHDAMDEFNAAYNALRISVERFFRRR